jgi:hypothetical protein
MHRSTTIKSAFWRKPVSSNEKRAQIISLLNRRPFRPFVISLDNGDRLTVEHPETVAYDPTGASTQFSVLTGGLMVASYFRSVTSIALQDTGETVSS